MLFMPGDEELCVACHALSVPQKPKHPVLGRSQIAVFHFTALLCCSGKDSND